MNNSLAHKTFHLYYKGFYWVAALKHLLHKQFRVHASRLEASCFTNAHTSHTCPAFSQTCLEEFFSSSQILGLLALLLYVVCDSCKSFLQTHLFVGIYSVFLLFCIPVLPSASPSPVRIGLCIWLSLITRGCSLCLLLSGSHPNCCRISESCQKQCLKRMYIFNCGM